MLGQTVVAKENDGENYYLYVARQNHLLQLECDEDVYKFVIADGEQTYNIACEWNKLTYRGKVLRCEHRGLVLGTPMNMDGNKVGIGQLLGTDPVYEHQYNSYPDPYAEGEGVKYVYEYRYFYYDQNVTDETGSMIPINLLTVSDCYSTMKVDDDEDSVVELFVLTRYKEKPYMRYDLIDGEIAGGYVDELPEQVEAAWKQMKLLG